MSLPTKRKKTHIHREQSGGCQEWGKTEERWIGNLGLVDVKYFIYGMDK